MTGATRQALRDRAAYHQVELGGRLLDQLVIYFELLQRWNRTINLTALRESAEGLDRLLIEPVAAAGYLPRGKRLLDVGSGGGSPAIPLALATGAAHLGMVESRARKAAFLRETIRQLHLQAEVHTERVETLCLADGFSRTWDVISIRGIRVDVPLLTAVLAAIKPDGTLALFASGPVSLPAPFRGRTPVRLLRGMESYLTSATVE